MRLVLASGSPRRLILLRLLVGRFEVEVPDVDETLPARELGKALEEVAMRKAHAVAAIHSDAIVFAADTVVATGGEVLGKPADPAAAAAMLGRLNHQPHQVVTGLAVASPDTGTHTAHVVSEVTLRIPPPVATAYLASGAWQGKAGSYGIQDPLLAPHIQVTGPWSNVVGLPVSVAAALLRAAGVTVRDPPDEEWLRRHNPFDDQGC